MALGEHTSGFAITISDDELKYFLVFKKQPVPIETAMAVRKYPSVCLYTRRSWFAQYLVYQTRHASSVGQHKLELAAADLAPENC